MSLVKYRQDIQILRGVAVLLVVLYHVKMAGFDNGLLGVDVFFVVSGYLMALLYDKRSPSEFLLARLNRLVPAYAVVTVLTLVTAYFVTVPADFQQVSDQAAMGAGFLSNFYYWNQSSYFQSQDFNPLLNYWSLSVEVQFYLFVPFLFPLLRKRRALALGLFGLSLLLCLAVLTKSEKTAFFMLPTRMWEFLLGAFAAWYGQRESFRRGRLGAGFLGLLLAVVFLFPLSQGTQNIPLGHPSFAALVVTALTAGLLVTGLPRRFETSLPGRMLTRLGDISYSVYLVHFPVIVLVNYQPFGGTVLGYQQDLIELSLILGLTIGLAIPLYLFVERSRRFRAGKLVGLLPVALVLVAVSITAAELRMALLAPAERNIVAALTDNNQRRCPLSFRVLHPTEKLCRFGPADAQQTIALIGDSHAVSIRDSFVQQAGRHGFSTYFSASNLPLLDRRFPVSGMDDKLSDPQLAAVILHYRSTKFDVARNREKIAEFIRRSTERGVPVILLAPIPTYPDQIPKFMYASLTAGGGNMTGLQITDTQARVQNSAFWDFVDDLPKSDVTVIDPVDLLCAESACNYYDAALHPYYYDEHHLTLTGAAQLHAQFETILTQVAAQAGI